jgi:hypothetical protein
VPVCLIAGLIAGGAVPTDLMLDDPRVTPAMIEIAPVYATAYPSQGRPRANAWDDRMPVSRTRRKLAAIPAGRGS